MRTVLVAAAMGAIVGLVRRDRPRHGADRRVRWWPVLAVGIALQFVASWAGEGGLAILLASYVALVAFAVANLGTAGMWLVALGVALNMVVITANEAMPVRPAALVDAGLAGPGDAGRFPLSGKRRLERPGDHLTALADVVPVRPLAEVVSFGDLVMAAGVANVLASVLRRPAAGQRRWR